MASAGGGFGLRFWQVALAACLGVVGYGVWHGFVASRLRTWLVVRALKSARDRALRADEPGRDGRA
jgi:hypothetical protein